ncbi:MAG: hypothetical protein ABI024_07040 [Vicinamibacterales bacterium]
MVPARPGRHVGTVGRPEITPNSPNVIPGQAVLSVELRALSEATLTMIGAEIQRRAAAIALLGAVMEIDATDSVA